MVRNMPQNGVENPLYGRVATWYVVRPVLNDRTRGGGRDCPGERRHELSSLSRLVPVSSGCVGSAGPPPAGSDALASTSAVPSSRGGDEDGQPRTPLSDGSPDPTSRLRPALALPLGLRSTCRYVSSPLTLSTNRLPTLTLLLRPRDADRLLPRDAGRAPWLRPRDVVAPSSTSSGRSSRPSDADPDVGAVPSQDTSCPAPLIAGEKGGLLLQRAPPTPTSVEAK